MAVFITWCAPALSIEPIVYEGVSSEQPCKTFDEAPVCIAKTWKACMGFFGYYSSICPMIGLPVEAELNDPEVKKSWLDDEKASPDLAKLRNIVRTEPWTLAYSQIVAAGNYEAEDIVSAIGPVKINRAGPGKPLPTILKDTVEVAMSTYVEDTWTNDSIFVKRSGTKWIFVAHHSAGSGFMYTPLKEGQALGWKEDCNEEQQNRSPGTCAKFVYGLLPYDEYVAPKQPASTGN